MSTSPDKRIPVYLLTGYLGSGKTSLLKSWLGQPEFQDAALIINELGEVGLDNQLLSGASESAALVANACICCTGLPGLTEALEDLFWARLERRMHRFPSVVIETTGLAEPGPVVAAMNGSELLQERYRLAGVITCLSAPTASDVLNHHAEARAQLSGADLLVVTKTDLVDQTALQALQLRLTHQLAHTHSLTRVRTSARSALSSAQAVAALQEQSILATVCAPQADEHGLAHDHQHDHGHHGPGHQHAAEAFFWPVSPQLEQSMLQSQLAALQTALGHSLLRLKGRVVTAQGAFVVQMAPFEREPVWQADHDSAATETGLTVIVSWPLSEAQLQALHLHIQATPSSAP